MNMAMVALYTRRPDIRMLTNYDYREHKSSRPKTSLQCVASSGYLGIQINRGLVWANIRTMRKIEDWFEML
jgi:hypothetical protein